MLRIHNIPEGFWAQAWFAFKRNAVRAFKTEVASGGLTLEGARMYLDMAKTETLKERIVIAIMRKIVATIIKWQSELVQP